MTDERYLTDKKIEEYINSFLKAIVDSQDDKIKLVWEAEEILNLIERQQKEIEYWKYKCDKEVSENIVNITKIVNQNNRINKLEKINDKYLQKLVYALSPTTHTLGDDYNSKFKNIIKDNIDLETCKIKRKLKECWGIDKY